MNSRRSIASIATNQIVPVDAQGALSGRKSTVSFYPFTAGRSGHANTLNGKREIPNCLTGSLACGLLTPDDVPLRLRAVSGSVALARWNQKFVREA
jgi:hypothetical protein